MKIDKKKQEQVEDAIKIIDTYYKKPMVFDNENGSFHNRHSGLDESPENIIAWANKIKIWKKES